MPRVIFLGTAAAIPDENHENTHLAIIGDHQTYLVDTAGNPIARLKRAGIDPVLMAGIILTHFHPDHTYALPLLLMDMWLLGRQKALDIYGLEETLSRMEKALDAYGWTAWPGFFQVHFHSLPAEGKNLVLQTEEFTITETLVCHIVPTIGLRIESKSSGKVFAYSCDTEPCAALIDLACEADFLVHEAAGKSKGHTSPEQAGEVASQARARSLYLIHYPVGDQYHPEAWIKSAQATYSGEVTLAQDFLEVEF